MNKIRRRLLLAAGKDAAGVIFKSGVAKINGEIAREKNVSVRAVNILIATVGYLSIKADFTNFSKLNIEISLLESTGHGTQYGYGNSATAFTRSYTKTTAVNEVKTFDISSVTGEHFINFVAGEYTDSTITYIANIWME